MMINNWFLQQPILGKCNKTGDTPKSLFRPIGFQPHPFRVHVLMLVEPVPQLRRPEIAPDTNDWNSQSMACLAYEMAISWEK
jgi:hypothetical protein